MPYWKDPYTPIESGNWGFPDQDTEYVVIDAVYTQYYAGGPYYWESEFKTELNEKYTLIADISGCRLYKLNP